MFKLMLIVLALSTATFSSCLIIPASRSSRNYEKSRPSIPSPSRPSAPSRPSRPIPSPPPPRSRSFKAESSPLNTQASFSGTPLPQNLSALR
ncbi:MAG: hypothetical protein LBQ77_04505 [Treponema sp.]|nr:hypothetical protein [Treponema sp.]